MSKHEELIAEYRPTMHVEVLHSWAKDAKAALQAQAREIEGLRKDAERYRWLRQDQQAADPLFIVWRRSGINNWAVIKQTDANIDSAMDADKGAPHG